MRLSAGFFAALCALAQAPAPATHSSGKNAIGMEFVRIAPGAFTMGCSEGDTACTDDERPAHRVQITKPFEIGKFEVTQAQWQAVMGSNPSTIKGADHPVETISKNDAQDFIAKLNGLNDGFLYRLPTEAEWEYAARAGTSGSPASLDAVAWYGDNSGDTTHPVGQKQPNAWGLYDMLGNVREWVADNYTRDYYANSPAADPGGAAAGPGPRGGGRRGFGGGNFGGRGRGMRQLPIMRGGAWDNNAEFVRFSARYHYYGPTLRVSDIGVRVVRVPASEVNP